MRDPSGSIPKIVIKTKSFVRVQFNCGLDNIRHNGGRPQALISRPIKIVQLHRPGFHIDQVFYDEAVREAETQIRAKSLFLQNLQPGTLAVLNGCMVSYMAKPAQRPYRVNLPITPTDRQTAPDPSLYKLHDDTDGHEIIIRFGLNLIKPIRQKPIDFSMPPPPPPAQAPPRPPTPVPAPLMQQQLQPSLPTHITTAMETFYVIAANFVFTPPHITLEKLSRMLANYLKDTQLPRLPPPPPQQQQHLHQSKYQHKKFQRFRQRPY